VHHYYHETKANRLAALSGCFHLKRLISLGFESDVRFCLETNCASAVPVFADGRLFLENK
jgi:phosphosulfolactate phosphohydrolase-like enzyme